MGVRFAMITGQRISHFEILDKLGEGGMGVVYKARDLDLNRFVALKMLPSGVGADPSRRARFLQEAQAASALNHPNIVTVYEIFREGGNEFIAMEYLDGKTLGDLIGPRGLKIEEALRLGEQIATALAAAHGAGIVHRDLKPANVMVTGLGLAKVLDFGLAKLTETGPEDATLTEAGTVMGTLAYMSPEQAEGRKVDWRSDIFSFGTLLYEMVTGRRAFDGDGRVQTLAAVLEKEPATPGDAVPRELQRLIARCMKKKAGERSQSMVDVKHALEELRAEIASGAMSGVHAAVPLKKASRWPLAAAAVVVLAVGGIWMMSGRKTEAVIYKPVPFTSYPGLEQDPALSPDGKFVAFSWNGPNQDNFDIYVRRVGPGEPLRLTQSPGPDRFPAWSPNGDMVAFFRGGTTELRGVFVIPALGGTERRVSRGGGTLTLSVTWTPDGKALLLGSAHWFTLLQVETGEESRLAVPIRRTSHFHVTNPAFSPDGRELAFVVSDSVEGDSIHIVGWSAGGKVEGTDRVVTTGRSGAYLSLAWSADGKSIFIADSQGGIPKPFRLRANGDAVPELMAGLGEHITDISASGTRLVYSNRIQDLDLWRMEIGGGKFGPVAQFLKSTRSEGSPKFSPDGKEIAFISDRSGEAELWVANADGSNLRQLTKAAPVFGLSWSPDSLELLYRAIPSKGTALFRIRSQGGSPRQIGPSGVQMGRWLPDGKTIVYTAAPGSDTYRLYKIDAEGKGAPEVIEGSEQGGADINAWFLSADGRDIWRTIMPLRIGEAPVIGLIRHRLPNGEPVVLAAKNGVGAYSFESEGVYFVAVDSDVLQYCRYSDNKVTDIATLPERFLRGGRTRFTVSPDGKTVIFSKADETISDLYLVEGVSK